MQEDSCREVDGARRRGVSRRVAVMASVGTFLLGALVAGSVSIAEAGSSGTTYYGCVHAGALSKVGTAKPSCPKGSDLISWNSVGPKGPTGFRGPRGATGYQGPAGPVHQVTGAINSNCTLQDSPPSSVVTSSQVASGECELTFPESEFTGIPVIQLTPIGGSNATGVSEGQNSNGTWFAEFSFSSPTLANFIASQVTT